MELPLSQPIPSTQKPRTYVHQPASAGSGDTISEGSGAVRRELSVSEQKRRETFLAIARTAMVMPLAVGLAGLYAKAIDGWAVNDLRTVQEIAAQVNTYAGDNTYDAIDELLEENCYYIFNAPDKDGIEWVSELTRQDSFLSDKTSSLLDSAQKDVDARNNLTIAVAGAGIGMTPLVGYLNMIAFKRRFASAEQPQQPDTTASGEW